MGHRQGVLAEMWEEIRDSYDRGVTRAKRVYSLCSRRSLRENLYETLVLGERGIRGGLNLTRELWHGTGRILFEKGIIENAVEEEQSDEKVDYLGLVGLLDYIARPKNREELVRNINYIGSQVM